MGLISLADYKNLPAEPTLRWLELHDLRERRISFRMDDDGPFGRGKATDSDLVEFCTVLAEAANTLDLASLERPSAFNIRENFIGFRADATALATRLSLSQTVSARAQSIALERGTKKKIIQEIECLRRLISDSDLSDKQKDRLERKLSELHALVVSPRLDMVKALVALTVIGSLTAESTAFLADAPAALGTITTLIGVDKAAEDEEAALLQGQSEPPSLPGPRSEGPVDDDITF